ncbi:MAG: SDR family oxidoreductase [Deltaproteobacteria bacterium]|nr:SDR family oxidoreductase [Deltaproteobacteria bacterium]
MDLHLTDKVALVTGASQGIGLAIVRALAGEGARVVAGARTESAELRALESQGRVSFVKVDLSTADGPAELVKQTVARHDRLDLLVNNVGIGALRTEGFIAISDDEWLKTWNLDFMAALRTMRAAIPHLLARSGSVVTIGSVNAYLPDPSVIDYCAAKAALLNLSKALSKEFGGKIRFNTIAPGPVETPFWMAPGGIADSIAKKSGIDISAAIAQVKASMQLSTGRFTKPEEVADLVLLLASDRAANVTGSDFLIDGGLIKTL